MGALPDDEERPPVSSASWQAPGERPAHVFGEPHTVRVRIRAWKLWRARALTPSLTHSLTLSRSLSLTHTLSLTHSLYISRALSLTPSLAHSFAPTHTLSRSLTLSISLPSSPPSLPTPPPSLFVCARVRVCVLVRVRLGVFVCTGCARYRCRRRQQIWHVGSTRSAQVLKS